MPPVIIVVLIMMEFLSQVERLHFHLQWSSHFQQQQTVLTLLIVDIQTVNARSKYVASTDIPNKS